MLETCTDLIACEKCLRNSLGKYEYIGQVDLSRDDLDKLSQLMAVKIKADTASSIEFFREYTPACIAFFLVGQGIWNYQEGDYWTSVSTSLGLTVDSALQLRLGRIFLQFINAQGLQTVSIPGSHRYVTPILLHGGVPQNSLPLLFQRVVSVLIAKNICTSLEIIEEIEHFRKLEEKKQIIQQSIEESKQKQSNRQSEIKKLQSLKALNIKAKELQRKCQQWDEWEDLPEDCEQHYAELLEELHRIKDRKKNLIEREQVWNHLVSSWHQKEKELLDLLGKANQVKEREQWLAKQEEVLAGLHKEAGHSREVLFKQALKIWSEGWKDDYGRILDRIDGELLRCKLYQYGQIQQRYRLVVWEGFLLVSLAYHSLGKNQEAELEYGRQQVIFEQELAAVGNGLFYNQTSSSSNFHQETGAQSLVDKFRMVNQKLSIVKEDRERVRNELQAMLGGSALQEDGLAIPFDSPDSILNEFISLRQIYHQYSQLCSSQEQLQARIRQEAESNAEVLRELILRMELQHSTINPAQLIVEIEVRLGKTRQKRYMAVDSGKSLQVRISTELKELEEVEQARNREIKTLEARLLKLGQGNLARGIYEVKARVALQNDWQDIVQQINDQIKFIPELTFPLEENIIADMLEQKTQEQYVQKKQTDEQYQELNRLDMFTGIDEPLYRFLLYGGEWAKDWVSAAVSLYLRAVRSGAYSVEVGETLPSRVRDGFIDWWQDNCSEPSLSGSSHLSGEEYYTTPCIVLDPDGGKISLNIGLQRFYLDRDNLPRNITCQIWGDNNKLLQNIKLKTYYANNQSALVETEPVNVSLLQIVESYQIYLQLDEQVKHEWVINGIGDDGVLLVFNEGGKRMPLAELGRQRIWLLLDPAWQLAVNIPVLEETEIRWADKLYILRLIDCTDAIASGLELLNQYGEQLFYPFQDSSPFLQGGEKYPLIYCEDLPVYQQAPEILYCPWQDMSPYVMADWKLVVKKGYCNPVICYSSRLDQLPPDSIAVVNNYMQIELFHPALLGVQPQGRYDLQLRGPGWERYTFTIVAIPNLNFGFEPQCCWPAETPDSLIKLTFFVPEQATIDVDAPAVIVDGEDEVYEIVITQEENQITGQLRLQCGEEQDYIPLAIEIPKIRWRIQGLDEERYAAWQDKMQELWIGELHSSPEIYLETEIPAGLGSYVELGLDTGQIVPGIRTRNDILRFKLLNFIDSLQDGESIHVFALKIYGRGRTIRDEGSLFSVRCCWEVVNIEVFLENHQGQDFLQIKWEEKGEAADRVLYLWRVEQPWLLPNKWQISEGVCHLLINLTDAGVDNGPYLLHFDTEDPWGQYTEPSFPADAINTSPIIIDKGDLYLNDLRVTWLNNKEAVITGNLINNTSKCKIRVVLMGIVSNTLVYWQTEVDIVGEDCFAVKLGGLPTAVGSDKKQWLVKRTVCRETAHWLGVVAEGQSYHYKFHLLSAAAPLELNLDKLIELSSWPGGSLKLKFKSSNNKYQLSPVLGTTATQKLISAWCGQNNAELYEIETESGHLEVSGANRETQLLLKNGIICIDPKCSGFGQLLPDIQEWYKNHPFCRGFEYNITRVKGELFWLWDSGRLVEECYHKYNCGVNGLILLQQGNEQEIIDFGNYNNLAQLLWEQEKMLFSIIEGGQSEQ